VDPIIRRQATPEAVWRVNFRAPEWDEPVVIKVRVEGEKYDRQVMRRQTLEQLEGLLDVFPKPDEVTDWFRHCGIKIDSEVAFYEWHVDDILETRKSTRDKTSCK
jgi:hypothetical protein